MPCASFTKLRLVAFALWVALAPVGALAADRTALVLLVQPMPSDGHPPTDFQPLAEYLARQIGRGCELRTSPNALAHWDTVRRQLGFDLVLDEAHFTDYRIQKFGFEVIAKLPGTVSYSLLVPADVRITDPSAQLLGKRVATLGVPSLGAARLQAMYPDPTRQPHIAEAANADEALHQLTTRRAYAAFLPTAYVSQQVARGMRVTAVMTTEPIPERALSAGVTVDTELRRKIRVALLEAENTPEGRHMLKAAGLTRFEPTDAETYAGAARVLKAYWGY